jgi:hypothetical protein
MLRRKAQSDCITFACAALPVVPEDITSRNGHVMTSITGAESSFESRVSSLSRQFKTPLEQGRDLQMRRPQPRQRRSRNKQLNSPRLLNCVNRFGNGHGGSHPRPPTELSS